MSKGIYSSSSINERQKNRYDAAEKLVKGETSKRADSSHSSRSASTGRYVTTSRGTKQPSTSPSKK
jgi:hypothetical protein